ncbi:MAG TPA: hypothetical protein PLQ35_17365 [bacterium]|mgnify:CR=1 FL=1|nr:hypothetical protein [bacterium]HQL64047.1 hypothetical protein [bacterium]
MSIFVAGEPAQESCAEMMAREVMEKQRETEQAKRDHQESLKEEEQRLRRAVSAPVPSGEDEAQVKYERELKLFEFLGKTYGHSNMPRPTPPLRDRLVMDWAVRTVPIDGRMCVELTIPVERNGAVELLTLRLGRDVLMTAQQTIHNLLMTY